jgi:hypothetical protein
MKTYLENFVFISTIIGSFIVMLMFINVFVAMVIA